MINPSLLILIAIILLIAELFVPAFGMLGLAGLISFVVGTYTLLSTLDSAERATVLYMIVPSTLVFLGLAATITTVLFKGRRLLFQKPEITPVGEVGEAADDFVGRNGMIRIEGELWTAELIDDKVAKRGEQLLVMNRNGLKLTVQHVQKL